MRYVVGSLVGVALVAALVVAGGAGHATRGEAEREPAICTRYEDAMKHIAEERFLVGPDRSLPALLARKRGGVPLIGYLASPPPVEMEWECSARELSVVVRGPWTLGAADMEAALELLLEDLRKRELRPVEDGVVIVMESPLMDESARFDGAQVERDFTESLRREAGLREPSIFDTYDYGPLPPLRLIPSLAPAMLEEAAGSGE